MKVEFSGASPDALAEEMGRRVLAMTQERLETDIKILPWEQALFHRMVLYALQLPAPQEKSALRTAA